MNPLNGINGHLLLGFTKQLDNNTPSVPLNPNYGDEHYTSDGSVYERLSTRDKDDPELIRDSRSSFHATIQYEDLRTTYSMEKESLMQ